MILTLLERVSVLALMMLLIQLVEIAKAVLARARPRWGPAAEGVELPELKKEKSVMFMTENPLFGKGRGGPRRWDSFWFKERTRLDVDKAKHSEILRAAGEKRHRVKRFSTDARASAAAADAAADGADEAPPAVDDAADGADDAPPAAEDEVEWAYPAPDTEVPMTARGGADVVPRRAPRGATSR